MTLTTPSSAEVKNEWSYTATPLISPLGNLEGGSYTGDFERGMEGSTRVLQTVHLSPRELYEGNLEGGHLY
jgi:hypothetical protein